MVRKTVVRLWLVSAISAVTSVDPARFAGTQVVGTGPQSRSPPGVRSRRRAGSWSQRARGAVLCPAAAAPAWNQRIAPGRDSPAATAVAQVTPMRHEQ